MKTFLEKILGFIVDDPKNINIEDNYIANSYNFVINVGQNEIAKVIGKNGNVIRAVRTLMRIKGIKEGSQVFIKLQEAG